MTAPCEPAKAAKPAKCATVSTTTVVGWTYDTGADNTDCAAATCAVQDGGADQDTCFNQNVCR